MHRVLPAEGVGPVWMENSASGSHGIGVAFIPSTTAPLEGERTGGYVIQQKVKQSHRNLPHR